jgi:hypothetical protein
MIFGNIIKKVKFDYLFILINILNMIKLYSPKGFLLLFFLNVLIFSQLSCKKKEQAIIPTDLKVTARFYTNRSYADSYYSKTDEIDSATGANVTVMLFRTLVDMEARVRPVLTGKTDGNGDLTLKGVDPFPYFVYVCYDDTTKNSYYDNSIGNYNLGEAMVEGGITGVSIPIFKVRPSNPQKIGMNYVEVIRYDTLAARYDTTLKQNLPGGCSNYLKFMLYDQYNDSIPLDSTRSDSFSQFCPKSSTTSENAQKFYFNHLDSLYDISSFGDNNYFKLVTFESSNPDSLFNRTDSIFLYPSVVFKDNHYKFLPYPTRVRIKENEHKIIDINWAWK